MTSTRTFSEQTTARVGGPAGDWVVADSEDQLVAVLSQHPLPEDALREAGQDSLLVLGGGSNLVVSDEGFAGTVLQIATTGISAEPVGEGQRAVTIAAGHSWDDAVAWTVSQGLSGFEALSGIPGATGATPVQNVGAYGAEVSQTLMDLRAWDRASQEVVVLGNEQLAFGYRDSLLKRSTLQGSPRYVVLTVRFMLTEQPDPETGKPLSGPVRYGELGRRLGLEAGVPEDQRRAPLFQVREAVLELRAGKGMVLDADDPDTWSTGSFFTNPIVPAEKAASLPEGSPQFPAGVSQDGTPQVKLSAAWLIDKAGCAKGFGAELTGGRASLSTKHTLAVTNRGGARTADLLTVARAVQERVNEAFGIVLHPEPVLLGCSL